MENFNLWASIRSIARGGGGGKGGAQGTGPTFDGKGNSRRGFEGLIELWGVQVRLNKKFCFYFKQLLENPEYLG